MCFLCQGLWLRPRQVVVLSIGSINDIKEVEKGQGRRYVYFIIIITNLYGGNNMSSEKPKRILFSVIWLIMLTLATFSVVPTECHAFDFEITIDVAPNVLKLQSKGQVVTVHTDIDYEDVVGSTVYMTMYIDGVASDVVDIHSWKDDLRGYFVAKFVMEEIKLLPLVAGEYNTLTLGGDTISNDEFSGSQDIFVVDNVPNNSG